MMVMLRELSYVRISNMKLFPLPRAIRLWSTEQGWEVLLQAGRCSCRLAD